MTLWLTMMHHHTKFGNLLLWKKLAEVDSKSRQKEGTFFFLSFFFHSSQCLLRLIRASLAFVPKSHAQKNQLRTLKIHCPSFSHHQWYEKYTNSTLQWQNNENNTDCKNLQWKFKQKLGENIRCTLRKGGGGDAGEVEVDWEECL